MRGKGQDSIDIVDMKLRSGTTTDRNLLLENKSKRTRKSEKRKQKNRDSISVKNGERNCAAPSICLSPKSIQKKGDRPIVSKTSTFCSSEMGKEINHNLATTSSTSVISLSESDNMLHNKSLFIDLTDERSNRKSSKRVRALPNTFIGQDIECLPLLNDSSKLKTGNTLSRKLKRKQNSSLEVVLVNLNTNVESKGPVENVEHINISDSDSVISLESDDTLLIDNVSISSSSVSDVIVVDTPPLKKCKLASDTTIVDLSSPISEPISLCVTPKMKKDHVIRSTRKSRPTQDVTLLIKPAIEKPQSTNTIGMSTIQNDICPLQNHVPCVKYNVIKTNISKKVKLSRKQRRKQKNLAWDESKSVNVLPVKENISVDNTKPQSSNTLSNITNAIPAVENHVQNIERSESSISVTTKSSYSVISSGAELNVGFTGVPSSSRPACNGIVNLHNVIGSNLPYSTGIMGPLVPYSNSVLGPVLPYSNTGSMIPVPPYSNNIVGPMPPNPSIMVPKPPYLNCSNDLQSSSADNRNITVRYIETESSGNVISSVGEQQSQLNLANVPSPSVFGKNVYNPNPKAIKTGLRPIVIDGSNVAMGHTNGRIFSSRGLQICINYFLKRNHKVIAFVPHFRKCGGQSSDPQLLHSLEKMGLVTFTPSRKVGDKWVVPYDDRYIVQYAAESGGVIVSTDNYRDLLLENHTWRETIERRLLMFTWVEDVLMFPQDPLGKSGPSLEKFLMFP